MAKRMSPKAQSGGRTVAGAGYENSPKAQPQPVMYSHGDPDSEGVGVLHSVMKKPYQNIAKTMGKGGRGNPRPKGK